VALAIPDLRSPVRHAPEGGLSALETCQNNGLSQLQQSAATFGQLSLRNGKFEDVRSVHAIEKEGRGQRGDDQGNQQYRQQIDDA
jgi:hypothetical protein